MEMCASVRECPPSGKSDDGVARALDGIAQRVAMMDPAVEVWRAQLAVSAAESERLAMLLSRDEHARAARFQFARDRNRYIAGRGMLRVLLGKLRRCSAIRHCVCVQPAWQAGARRCCARSDISIWRIQRMSRFSLFHAIASSASTSNPWTARSTTTRWRSAFFPRANVPNCKRFHGPRAVAHF